MITRQQQRSIRMLVLIAIPLLYLCSHTCYARALTLDEPLAVVETIVINDLPQTEASNVDSLQVEVKRVGTGLVEPATVGMELFKDDEVTTGEQAQVTLVFAKPDSEDRIEVMLKEKSKARISSIFGYFGSFFISGLGAFDTRTSYVRLGKRGTEFELFVADNGDVDLKVLRGEVDVEKLEPPPTPDGNHHPRRGTETPQPLSRAPGTGEIKTVQALEAIEIKKEHPLPHPRKLADAEVVSVLDWTDKLIIASFGAPPKNIIATTFDKSTTDPSAAIAAFKLARQKATLQASATNVQTLGDTYKDLGDGKRSMVEYVEAVKLNPSIKNSSVFLANQAEAYRLTGNLTKAEGLLREATAKLPADPTSQQLVLNASGNVFHDRAFQSILNGEAGKASGYFREAKIAYQTADSKSGDGENSATIKNNLNNVLLAVGLHPRTSGDKVDLNGTYQGTIDFPGEGLQGPSILIVTGDRFNLQRGCEATLTGSLITRKSDANKTFVDLVFDSTKGVKQLHLQTLGFGEPAQGSDWSSGQDDQIFLTSAPGEKHNFRFSGELVPRASPVCGVSPDKHRLRQFIDVSGGRPN